MKFTIYASDLKECATNCRYPYKYVVTDEKTLIGAITNDHVCAEYKNNYRGNDNFLSADVIPMDVDNGETDEPDKWISIEDVFDIFDDISFMLMPSRNHMKEKEGKSARPRFHMYFPITSCEDAEKYRALKVALQKDYPFFDEKCLDSGRQIFGSDSKEAYVHEGERQIDEILSTKEVANEEKSHVTPGVILEGSRNSTMSVYAAKVIKKYGNTQHAYDLFIDYSNRCQPPLDESELKSIWKSASKLYKKIEAQEGYVSPEEYNSDFDAVGTSPEWDEPIPFERHTLLSFPIDTLPDDIAAYVEAVAESTQTPLDMAGSVAISILSTCMQGKYLVRGKADWHEPVNTYTLVIAPSSERKSAVLNAMVKPVNEYEIEFNRVNCSKVERSKTEKMLLDKKRKALEDKIVKGKATMEELDPVLDEIAEFKEISPLKLYVDDITSEKLTSVIAENDGRASVISSEGGIFDTLAGKYNKSVNIDVMLKAYSGDTIRVDRIGRASESILNPTLTVLLMAQPNVIAEVLNNGNFRGRGLTARFLYCIPLSFVGSRNFNSKPIDPEVFNRYRSRIINMLGDEYNEKPSVITLSDEAAVKLESFANEIEPKLIGEYSEIADWAGKLVGSTLRIAGILCRAGRYISHDFLAIPEELIINGDEMDRAIRLGRYFLNHALSAYDVFPESDLLKRSQKALKKIKEVGLTEFTRRDAMRKVRSVKTADDMQGILDFLKDYGYIGTCIRDGRRKYIVNPRA